MRMTLLVAITLLATTLAPSPSIGGHICPWTNWGPYEGEYYLYYALTYTDCSQGCHTGVPTPYIGLAGEEAYCVGSGDCAACNPLGDTYTIRRMRHSTYKPRIELYLPMYDPTPHQVFTRVALPAAPGAIDLNDSAIPDNLTPAGNVGSGTKLQSVVSNGVIYRFTGAGGGSKYAHLASVSVKHNIGGTEVTKIVNLGVECSDPGGQTVAFPGRLGDAYAIKLLRDEDEGNTAEAEYPATVPMNDNFLTARLGGTEYLVRVNDKTEWVIGP